jgi:hypothetical protein
MPPNTIRFRAHSSTSLCTVRTVALTVAIMCAWCPCPYPCPFQRSSTSQWSTAGIQSQPAFASFQRTVFPSLEKACKAWLALVPHRIAPQGADRGGTELVGEAHRGSSSVPTDMHIERVPTEVLDLPTSLTRFVSPRATSAIFPLL